MSQSNHRIWAVVGVAVIKNGKLLFMRRANTEYMNGKLGFPGGHCEPRETPRQAAAREIKEEIGLDLSPERFKPLCVYSRLSLTSDETETVGYEFVLELDTSEEAINAEPDRCSELVWADPNNIPEDVIDEFQVVVEKSLIGEEHYLEIGYE